MSRLIVATPLGLVARWPSSWSSRSQEQARRNAMAACTVLAARRLERLEVEEFVAEQLALRAVSSTPAALEGVG